MSQETETAVLIRGFSFLWRHDVSGFDVI